MRIKFSVATNTCAALFGSIFVQDLLMRIKLPCLQENCVCVREHMHMCMLCVLVCESMCMSYVLVCVHMCMFCVVVCTHVQTLMTMQLFFFATGIHKVALEDSKLGITKDALASKILPFLIPISVDSNLNLTQVRPLIDVISWYMSTPACCVYWCAHV